ncbi:hypothetical protein [Actinomadura hibisca]|uniref:hypothetical protein n=1 Tax=Actinomadura hibisca TaxID=68565 RepID=UPI000829D2D1|nr:hypothetical protein [Actinomadura hibisca]
MNGAPHPALAVLCHRFPGVEIWRGRYTGHWLAIAGGYLLQAVRPDDLAAAIVHFTEPQARGPFHGW